MRDALRLLGVPSFLSAFFQSRTHFALADRKAAIDDESAAGRKTGLIGE